MGWSRGRKVSKINESYKTRRKSGYWRWCVSRHNRGYNWCRSGSRGLAEVHEINRRGHRSHWRWYGARFYRLSMSRTLPCYWRFSSKFFIVSDISSRFFWRNRFRNVALVFIFVPNKFFYNSHRITILRTSYMTWHVSFVVLVCSSITPLLNKLNKFQIEADKFHVS